MDDFRGSNYSSMNHHARRKAQAVEEGNETSSDFHHTSNDNNYSTDGSQRPLDQTAGNIKTAFVPSMPQSPSKIKMSTPSIISPFEHAGSLRAMSPARSPYFPAFAQQQQPPLLKHPSQLNHDNSCAKAIMAEWNNDAQKRPPAAAAASSSSSLSLLPHPPSKSIPLGEQPQPSSSLGSVSRNGTQSGSFFGPRPPHHYAREQFKSSTVHNDSNPIWGDVHGNFFDNNGNHNGGSSSTFHLPLKKDDFSSSAIHGNDSDGSGMKVALEIRLDEEMTPTESLLVGGALSKAVGAAASVTSVVGMGKQVQDVSHMGMELLGLGADRLIGRGYVDLTPLLLGLWEECWEEGYHHQHYHREHQQQQQQDEKQQRCSENDEDDNDGLGKVGKKAKKGGRGGKGIGGKGGGDNNSVLNEYGRIHPTARGMKRRVERMGMLDVWVPLYHPAIQSKNKASSNSKDKNSSNSNDNEEVETSGMVHLLISYEPNGMSPKKDDVVAFESFARRPIHGIGGGSNASENYGPTITPIVPPLSPLIVIDIRGPYLLLEYATSRTVTSVNRSGHVKSSRWERSHRVRIHRNAIFVIERHTLLDAAGDIARLPGDIVLSTPVGREVAEFSAPIVAGVMELMGPALLWGKLMMAMGGTGVRAGLAGARAATEAVVNASQEKALERREQGGAVVERGEVGVYSYAN